MSSDEQTQAPAATNQAGGGDPITNFKSEVDRKLGNVSKQMEQMAASQKALIDMLNGLKQQGPGAAQAAPVAAQDEDLEELWYKNPSKAAARIKADTAREIRQELAATTEQQQRHAQTIGALVRNYPELNDQDHALTKKAVELYSGMSDAEKTNPLAYKAAVAEAALELGIKPLNKRTDADEDSYSMSGSFSGAPNRGKKAKSDALPQATLDFARLVGLNVDDPQLVANLKKHAARDSWTKYR